MLIDCHILKEWSLLLKILQRITFPLSNFQSKYMNKEKSVDCVVSIVNL